MPIQTVSSTTVWWRVPMVWLVVGGPLAVVVASFVTLALALSHPDPVITEAAPLAADAPADLRSMEAVRPGREAATAGAALVPALHARNHAATGGR